MVVKNLYCGGWASNCYLVVGGNGQALVVDPSVPPSQMDLLFPENPPEIVGVILTHTHYDHMLYLDMWHKEGVPLYVGEQDAIGLCDTAYNVSGTVFGDPTTYRGADVLPHDGDEIMLGREKLQVMSTPGHTSGGISLVGSNFVITGDTMFAYGSVGRTDLLGSSYEDLETSIERLLSLAPQTKVFPGHGPSSTIASEREAHLI